MNPDSRPLEFWERVKEAFDKVWEVEPQTRLMALDQLCPDDAVRDEVRQMLIALSVADEFMEKPLIIDPSVFNPDQQIGRRIGPYQLTREIGRGGMSVVYLANGADEACQREVAVKLISPALDLSDIGWRFKRERQILARLAHPNIARLLSAGKTEDGWPYLVMEYVSGEPITEYCDRRQLSITARLALFSKVCEAVRYAHEHQVIHRDIKPNNIFVTEDGQVKLLDFGIAKLIKPENYGLTLHFTRPGLSLMTPESASPEQVWGGEITMATDVYGLGVVLYELLTGGRPYYFKNPTLGEIARVISEEEPARPSAAVSYGAQETLDDGRKRGARSPEIVSAARSTTPDQLRRNLKGNLDLIALKALHKDVGRRYQTVKELTDDLSRHLAGLPVKAFRRAFRYRAGKFAHRHREGILVAVFLALISALAYVLGHHWS
jgi:serine/threonine protein kinase